MKLKYVTHLLEFKKVLFNHAVVTTCVHSLQGTSNVHWINLTQLKSISKLDLDRKLYIIINSVYLLYDRLYSWSFPKQR